MTLDDLWARFKVIDSLNTAKMAKYSLESDACRVAECIMSIRPMYSCTGLLTYLFTYLHNWLGAYKKAISPKRLKIKRKLLLTAYNKSSMGFRLPSKCMTLNDRCAIFKVIDSLNAAKMAKYSQWRSHGWARVGTCPPYLNQGGSWDLHKFEEFFEE